MVRDRFCMDYKRFVGAPEWFSRLFTLEESEEWVRFSSLLEGARISSSPDRWVWLGKKNEEFSVKSVKGFIRSSMDKSGRFLFKWAREIPKKCNIFMWRASMDRIPTYKALQSRNCFFGMLNCGLCEAYEETIVHLLCHCQIAIEVWGRIASWCKVSPFVVSSIKDLVELFTKVGFSKRKSKIFKGIIFIAC
uniref:uncharacterized protein LOC122601499 n=1 Tax=Erigeron canadensis TaxID=72917 RepID=UPI001CB986F3|nr:uncharacterized protein LOC122601499 [Erigeron canadensis]